MILLQYERAFCLESIFNSYPISLLTGLFLEYVKSLFNTRNSFDIGEMRQYQDKNYTMPNVLVYTELILVRSCRKQLAYSDILESVPGINQY